jgi:hypothetical protein
MNPHKLGEKQGLKINHTCGFCELIIHMGKAKWKEL